MAGKSSLLQDSAGPLLALVAIFLFWQYALYLFVPTFIVPKPSDIFLALVTSGIPWYYHSLVTLYEVVAGFVAAVVFGIGLALVMGASKRVRQIVYPYVVILQIIPRVALAPILLLMFGFGFLPKIIIAFLIAFFPMVVNTLTGISSVSPEVLDVVHGLRATPFQVFRKVRFPAAMPYIFAGLRVSITLALIGAVVAEFISAGAGLGYLLIVSETYSTAALGFASLLVLSVMGILLYLLIIAAEKKFMPWHRSTLQPGEST